MYKFDSVRFANDLGSPRPNGQYLSQSDIARRTGMSAATVNRIFNGKELKIGEFLKLVNLMGYPPSEYFKRGEL